ncbi:expressed unknown protein [Seminavis robusta]|uniref:MIT domain-containing protein n=1 Tax=Seminavis robusta TaxID=568900 RepID=A0A9N8HB32_9STRA|nr:expressed unknown protein [Seminavis robusta]|eukprot:Sro168_g074790.1 n/a (207) ;mRNA; f:40016-40636
MAGSAGTGTTMAGTTASDCSVVLVNAIAADQAKDYGTALALYRTAVGLLLTEMEKTRNAAQPQKRRNGNTANQPMKSRVKELLKRAEELQRHLDDEKTRHHETLQRSGASSLAKTSQRRGSLQTQERNERPEGVNVNSEPEGGESKEWSFHFDMHIDISTRNKTSSSTPPAAAVTRGAAQDDNSEKGLLFKIIELLRFLPLPIGKR